MLLLYNTLSHKKQRFRSISDKEVRMYACGPTVYSFAHIGNMRTYLEEDVLKRTLLYDGYRVMHVMNITDVGHLVGDANLGEDKIKLTARKEHRSAHEVAEFYTGAFINDIKRLNILLPDRMPRATDHIPEMLALIKELDQKGYLYRVETGMYYDTSRFKDYGELTGMDFDRLNKYLKAGARVERASGLRNITDFAVWRFSQNGEKEMVWDSEWGPGFPGWHMECSAISMKYLGKHFDIHCGGVDHLPIHHPNEIAQSESVTGRRFVNYWVHLNFLRINNMKMAKSIGNVYTVQDIIDRGFSPMALRYFLISGHYRSELNFTFEALSNAQRTLNSIYSFIERLSEIKNDSDSRDHRRFVSNVKTAKKGFFKEVNNDLNMPGALSAMHTLISEANRRMEQDKLSRSEAELVRDTMLDFDRILGVEFAKHASKEGRAISDEVKNLIAEREQARKEKDFKKADEIRRTLKEKYRIILEDTREGVRWHFEN